MRSIFATLFTILVELKFAFHINFIPFGNIILTFTDGTNHCNEFPGALFAIDGYFN